VSAATLLKGSGVDVEKAAIAAERDLPDFDALALELVQLERREGATERRLLKVQDRDTTFPSETTKRHVTNLRDELLQTRRRINTIRAQLVPIMRLPRQ
jgi:hypothetical protein